MVRVILNQWDGGMTNDPHDVHTNVARSVKNFDNYTRSHKLTPLRSLKLDAVVESSLDTYRIQKFLAANGKLYGLGVVSAVDSHTQIYTKTTATDPTTVWTTAEGTSTSASSVETGLMFVVYHNYLYGANSGGIWKYGDITSGGSEAFTYNDYTTHVPTAQGLVHSKDDILYVPSGNLILRNISGSWSVALTLPANSTINCICEDGNFLDIACDQQDGTSVVYQWDRDSSLSTISEKIDWGVGSLKIIEVIGGILCGISTISASLNSLTPRVMFKYASGTVVNTFQELVASYVVIRPDKQKFNNLFYFMAEMTIDGVDYKGTWKMYRKPSGGLAISFDQNPRNDTDLTSGSLKSFYRWGDYMFMAYLTGTAYTVWRTDDQATYSVTAIFDTTINPSMAPGDKSLIKQLMAIGVRMSPLTSGQQVTLKYRVDGGSYSTIGTFNTSQSTELVVAERTGAVSSQFTSGREYEFRIESTGGPEPVELTYDYNVLKSNL